MRAMNQTPVEISYFCRSCKGHYIGYTDDQHLSASRVRCKCGAKAIHIYAAQQLSSLSV